MQLIFQFQFIFTQVQSEIRICMHSLNTLMALMPERPQFILIKVIIIMSSIICTIYIIICTIICMHRTTFMALPVMPQSPPVYLASSRWWPDGLDSILSPFWDLPNGGADSVALIPSAKFVNMSNLCSLPPFPSLCLWQNSSKVFQPKYWWFDSVVLPLNLCQPVGQLDVLPEVNFVTLQLFSLVWYKVMVMVMVD